MSWNPNPQEETTLGTLTSHFDGDIEYAIRAINQYKSFYDEPGTTMRPSGMLCAFWQHEGETFLDIRYDSKIRNQRDETLDSWNFGLGCYKHRKILIHSPHRTTGYWQRLWAETFMVMAQAEKTRMWNK